MIIRPIVLMDIEKTVPLPNPAIHDYNKRVLQVRQYEWNGQKNYFTIVGERYFYGEKPVLPEPIHVPEIHPTPVFTGSKIAVVHGQTTIWGELDVIDRLPDFYLKYKLEPTPVKVWTSDKLPGSLLRDTPSYRNNFKYKIVSFKREGNNNVTTETDISLKDNNPLYKLLAPRDGGVWSVMSYLEGDRYGQLTQVKKDERILGAGYSPYRALPYYITTIQDPKFEFKDFYGVNAPIVIPQQDLP